MPLSYLPAVLATVFARLATCLDRRSAQRLPRLLVGILFDHGRRTVTSWLRAGGLSHTFRRGYHLVGACGRRFRFLATTILHTVEPLVTGDRLVVAIDDTPTPRWGPCVEGAGIHRNPTPGPAGDQFVYGHVFVTLGQGWGCDGC